MYDIRYNLLASQFSHSLGYPVQSIQKFTPSILASNDDFDNSEPLVLVSHAIGSGSADHMTLLNMRTGLPEMLFCIKES